MRILKEAVDLKSVIVQIRKNLGKIESDLMGEVITEKTYVAVDEIDRLLSVLEQQ
jgi:hypothetical protein